VKRGPDEYQVPSEMGKGKKRTMKARQFPPRESGKLDGPGPGKYLPNYSDKPGMRSIHGKVSDLKDKEAKRQYVDIGTTFGNCPKWTIGRRETLNHGPSLE
jgi:hypothetical protein